MSTKPSEPTKIKIGPKKARELLATLLPKEQGEALIRRSASPESYTRELNVVAPDSRFNRRIKTTQWTKLARDMAEGRWNYDGQPIRIDSNGRLRDGQHRMIAIIASGKTLDFLVIEGLDPETYFTMDTGISRSAADQLRTRGVANASSISAATNLILRWRAGRIISSSSSATTPEIGEFVEKYEDELEDAVLKATRVRNALPNATQSVFSAAIFEGNQLDTDMTLDFVEMLVTGTFEDDHSSPIKTLRNKIIQYRSRPTLYFRQHQQLWHVVHAWNYWRDKRELKSLNIPGILTSESFPRMK